MYLSMDINWPAYDANEQISYKRKNNKAMDVSSSMDERLVEVISIEVFTELMDVIKTNHRFKILRPNSDLTLKQGQKSQPTS